MTDVHITYGVNMQRHILILTAWFVGSLVMMTAPDGFAQTFPTKPVKLVIPYAPGGATDILGRAIAQRLSDTLGQSVIIENKGGAGGNIGADFVAKSAPDGYTLVMGTIGTHAINPSIYASIPFDPVKDFAPVGLALTNQLVLLINSTVPARTLPELVAYSKTDKAKLFFGSAGNGSSHHLAGELLKVRSGLLMTHVPYKGSGPALVDLMGGSIQVLFCDIAGALPHLKAGRMIPLAVGGAKRSELMPDLPTVAEAANLPGFEVSAWMGVLAPAGTPPAIVAQLNGALNKVLAMTEIRGTFAGLGAEPLRSTPEEFASHIRNETAKWSKLVKAAGAKIE
jgi:tripartite-type tricarboxylate transporter receptor subunit TctC